MFVCVCAPDSARRGTRQRAIERERERDRGTYRDAERGRDT